MKVLRVADAVGQLPTPIDDLFAAAKTEKTSLAHPHSPNFLILKQA